MGVEENRYDALVRFTPDCFAILGIALIDAAFRIFGALFEAYCPDPP